MGKSRRELERLEERADALPRLRRRDPEQMHPLDRRYHELVGDLSFVPPGHMTPEEYESVRDNKEVQKLIEEYLNTPPVGAYDE